MAYTKQTWADLPSKTTPINANRLTHIEDGIFSAAQTADTAASTAGTAAANVGIVQGKVTTLEGQMLGVQDGLAGKVDKVTGKGLSTNDYTNTDKAKVDALGTASTKNSTSVVTQSTDLVESGAVYGALGFGNKNKLKFDLEKAIEYNADGAWSGNTFTKNGVTFTVNADNSISLERVSSNTSSAIFVIDGDFDTTAYEGYIFNGYNGITPSDAGVSIRVIEYSSNDNVQSLTDDATIINNGTPKRVAIRVASSSTPPQGSVVKPMISKDGGAYEPYHASVSDSLAEKADNSVIGTVEGANASKVWSVGEHFIKDGAFKEVTSPIANGEAINSGNTTDKPIADCFAFKGYIKSTSDNLDNYLENGIYSVSAGASNVPESKNYGMLIVSKLIPSATDNIIQLYCSAYTGEGSIYIRRRSQGIWRPWFKFTGTIVS